MRDECQMPLTCGQRSHGVIDSILAPRRSRGVADGRRRVMTEPSVPDRGRVDGRVVKALIAIRFN